MGQEHDVTAIVLAAGDGKRMKSPLPKVLHRVAGRPLLGHVLAALSPLELARTIVVVSRRGAEIKDGVAAGGWGQDVEYAVQDPARGTADAVRVALEHTGEPPGLLLVLPGDAPLVQTSTLEAMLRSHRDGDASVTVLTARVDDPTSFGRIVRGEGGAVERIVEEFDASDEERRIDEVNGGVYVFDAARLSHVIGKVDSENFQREFYLTDAIALLRAEGDGVSAHTASADDVMGANSRAELADVARRIHRRTCRRWLDEGVTIVDPETTYIDASVSMGADVTIHPFTFLEGETVVDDGAEVGPYARLVDSRVGPGARASFAVVVSSTVGPEASVGPFASLRAGTVLERGARVGTFVETKETTIGEDSKANHLAYLGDAEVGRGVNVGAGSITCNWDGKQKHRTVIEDDAYIGSDTMFVAPAHIGRRAATGAGAVVRGDVPDDALAVGAPARVIEGKGNKMGVEQREQGQEPRQ